MYQMMLIFWILLFGFSLGQTPYIPIPYDRPDSGDVTELKGPGEINWTQQVIKAKGWGIIDTTISKPQARLMATRAAQVVAQRNLLEITMGVKIYSKTTVADLKAKSDTIVTLLEGVLQGAQMVGEPVEKDGIIEVVMAIGLYDSKGIAPPIHKMLGINIIDTLKLTSEEIKKIEDLTGLCIDLEGNEIKPALFPRILDKNGNVILDPAQYYDPNDPKIQNLVKIINTVRKSELGKNPYIIKALKVIDSDIVVDDKEAKKISWLKKTFKTMLKLGKALWVLL